MLLDNDTIHFFSKKEDIPWLLHREIHADIFCVCKVSILTKREDDNLMWEKTRKIKFNAVLSI
jgi:hypothetical protein